MLVVEEVAVESMMLVTDPLSCVTELADLALCPSLLSLQLASPVTAPSVSAGPGQASGDSDAPRPGPAQPGPERAVNCERG